MQTSCKKPHYVTTYDTTGGGFLPAPFSWHSEEAGLATWDYSVGLAQGCSHHHHREFPSLILHKLRIKLLQHLFFFPDFLHSLNKGGDFYGKGMRSVSPLFVVPWVSHHHMILVIRTPLYLYPSGGLGERHLTSRRNTQTRPHGEQGWGAGTFGRR